MTIAFISYEYPPDTGIGGIATYIRQIALLFASRQIHVHVICGSPHQQGTMIESDYLSVTRIQCKGTEEFRKRSPLVAAQIHEATPIDLIEVPEYGAEGLFIKERLPGIPLIVKLHTPKFLLKQLNDHYYDQSLFRQLKKRIGLGYSVNTDLEYKAIQLADHILSPSRSLRTIVAEQWNIPLSRIIHAPNPYYPDPALLDLPIQPENQTILYMGRLETRKGVFNLAKAIPLVAQAVPDIQFIFLGKDSTGPHRERSMKQVLLREIGSFSSRVQFIDHVPLTEIPGFLEQAGICVFPSLWENFPNVCLEAMSAGKAVVGSREGGMSDMLGDVPGCVLVDPHSSASIAQGILSFVKDKQLRISTGEANRVKARTYYGDKLLDELVKLYHSFAQKQ